MATARVFRFGNGQAVRLSKEFRFDSDEVEIFRRGDEVVLRAKARDMQRAYQLLTELQRIFSATAEMTSHRKGAKLGR